MTSFLCNYSYKLKYNKLITELLITGEIYIIILTLDPRYKL